MLHIFHRSSDEDYGESSEEDDDDDEEEEEEEEEPLLDYKSFQKTNKKEADFWSHEAVDDVVKATTTTTTCGEEVRGEGVDCSAVPSGDNLPQYDDSRPEPVCLCLTHTVFFKVPPGISQNYGTLRASERPSQPFPASGSLWGHPALGLRAFGEKTNKKEADFWIHEAVDDVVKKYEAKELTAARAGEELLARPVCEWRAKNSVTAIAATIRRLQHHADPEVAATI